MSPLRHVLAKRRFIVITVAMAITLVIFSGYCYQGTYRIPTVDGSRHRQRCEESQSTVNLPVDYTYSQELSPFCADRFTHAYLEKLRNSATEYCSSESISSLTCFHSQTTESRTDSFCFGQSVTFDTLQKKFVLQCSLRSLDGEGIPRLDSLRRYWYETGPRVILDNYIHFDDAATEVVANSSKSFTILVKREGSGNPWHSLLEIFSMIMTLDVLQMAGNDKTTGAPLLSQQDFENTQVIILDNHDDGPYFDLWQLVAKRPTLRLDDLLSDGSSTIGNIIIPLAGASNPIWQGDWKPHSCRTSDLLDVFSRRVLDFYNTTNQAQQRDISTTITITFVYREHSRQLLNHEAHLEEIRQLFPHVVVQSVDFASIPFDEQLRVAQATNILVGVHGAGLTHALFLQRESVVVEILPSTLNYKGFRNLAGLLGHSYYSAHATEIFGDKKRGTDWHQANVEISQDRFVKLIELAIKSLYSKGLRDADVV